MMPIGVALTFVALVLLVVGRGATRAYLDAHVARYGKMPPNLTWFFTTDPDPEVEARRRASLAVRLPAIGLVAIGTVILVATTP